MFSNSDKIKELAIFFAKDPNVSFIAYENKNFTPVGVSSVITYKYDVNDMVITYNKWRVENYEGAKIMGLPGTEHHDQLVKGSGVNVSYKRLGSFTFYRDDAKAIINAYETYTDIEAHILQIKRQPQR